MVACNHFDDEGLFLTWPLSTGPSCGLLTLSKEAPLKLEVPRTSQFKCASVLCGRARFATCTLSGSFGPAILKTVTSFCHPKNLPVCYSWEITSRALKQPEKKKKNLKMANFPFFYSALSEVVSNNPKN